MKPLKTVLGFVAGLSVGALVGILYAPQKGTTTRKRIARKSAEYSDDIKDKFSDSVEGLKDTYESTKKDTMEWVDSAKDKTGEYIKNAKKSIK